MENNRTIIAIALIILVWSGYSMLFPPQPPPPKAVEQVAVESATSVSSENSFTPKSIVEEISVNQQPIVAPMVEKRVLVESDLYRYELTTSGARLRHAILKKYKVDNEPEAASKDIVEVDANNLATFKTSGKEGLSFPCRYPFCPSRRSYRISLVG